MPVPDQDVHGWKDRISTPALINDDNWTWRLPWPVEDMTKEPAARAAAAFTRKLAGRWGAWRARARARYDARCAGRRARGRGAGPK